MSIKSMLYKIGILLCILNAHSFAQSMSVFDANYFSKDGQEPPIEAGKGFDITDVFKQTRHCFTPESSHSNKLKSKNTGVKTTITLHYTKDEADYNYFKTNGVSGKVSYLSLFSVGGSQLQEFKSNSSEETERLIFLAKVDFGVYSFELDPILSAESTSLIKDKKFDEFIQLYGSHYISGLRKENSIKVILTKKVSANSSAENDNNTAEVGATLPFKVGVNFEVNQNEDVEMSLKKNDYDISIEIKGPPLASSDQNQLVNNINEILKNDEGNKINSIRELLSSSLVKISNPSQSFVSQYYYAPFSLYGLNSINWDERKQNNLIKINENVLRAYSSKLDLEDYISPNTLTETITDFNTSYSDFTKKNAYNNDIKLTYNKALPKVKLYKSQFDSCLVVLENLYKNCSDLHCISSENCCNINNTTEFINNLVYKAGTETDKFENIVEKAQSEASIESSAPECEKYKKGYIIIVNKSTNPYEIYQGDVLLETLKGGYQKKFTVNKGSYSFKASQQSGFLMYPTVNSRSATITENCQEVTLNIGFEDN